MDNGVPELLAERQARVDALGPLPPWWRLFKRRAWRRERSRIMATDVSTSAYMLRRIYSAAAVDELAARQHPVFTLIGKAEGRDFRLKMTVVEKKEP